MDRGFKNGDLRTVENYLLKHAEELAQNGYEMIRGKRLKEFKLCIPENDVPETVFWNISKAPQIGAGVRRLSYYLILPWPACF